MTIERTELITPEPARALAGLLQVEDPTARNDAELPLLWHWIYLLDRPAREDIGADGHPVRDTLPQPPGLGQRRMWAGGRVKLLGQLRFGEPATRRSTVVSSVEKQGRSGPLTLVTVSHRIHQDGVLVIDEEQDVVYRPHPAGSSAPPQTPGPAAIEPTPISASGAPWVLAVDSPLLFRYSALTYNGHRIHYDRDYAREIEGYPGLLVHGPLQATCMAEAARAQGAVRARVDMTYRLISPLVDFQGMVVVAAREGSIFRASVRDAAGRATAEGTITLT
ncbi:hypothetical protein JL108_13105 [Aeromicrobium sp. YIM 150415]|uniref:FAS1-like dehydratase domain-containing protein n=1 Tax=Aeromicrobium sp. YIM 150415 TaxID=2803912 RepID=UPI001965D29E|nr:MaoC family dehydratase N-terminal domain-containing protein [Aeromicrobium sp. YIM 150415]MBM9464392.1 hypothetical protein [Aeromicrobium sp. YIM 150415]